MGGEYPPIYDVNKINNNYTLNIKTHPKNKYTHITLVQEGFKRHLKLSFH